MIGLLAAALLVSGQKAFPSLEETVRWARTQPIMPHAEPPAWMDDAQIKAAYRLSGKNGRAIVEVLRTSSLAGTFAGRDITPVVMQTGRLPHEFTQRMHETEAQMFTIFIAPRDRADFLRRGYAKAYSLGQLHAAVGEAVKGSLRWNPRERLPMNAQSYALVLYSFAWWPVEVLIARKAVDPVTDRADLNAWFHLWSVIGYGMGTPESLLPRDYATAAKLIVLLRKAQYAGPGEKRPDGIPVLLGGNVRMAAESSKTTVEKAAEDFAALIALSPGLSDALGLGPNPAKRLAEYARK